jgi:hypothetical protein
MLVDLQLAILRLRGGRPPAFEAADVSLAQRPMRAVAMRETLSVSGARAAGDALRGPCRGTRSRRRAP